MSCRWKASREYMVEPFASDVTALLDADPGDWVITEAYRSGAQQDIYFAKGRDADGNIVDPLAVVTRARAGESAHNFGLAVDVVLIKDGKDGWNYRDADWQRMIASVKASPHLHSLVDIGDADHIEATHWRNHIPVPTNY